MQFATQADQIATQITKCVSIFLHASPLHFQKFSAKEKQYDGKPIKWTHLLHLQEWDRGTECNAPGLLLVPKLSFEHLHLTPGLRMRVSLAAQVQ